MRPTAREAIVLSLVCESTGLERDEARAVRHWFAK